MNSCHQASNPISSGSNIETICGYDCKTSQPLVVRFRGTPAPPERWESACKPPKKDGYDPSVYYMVGGGRSDGQNGAVGCFFDFGTSLIQRWTAVCKEGNHDYEYKIENKHIPLTRLDTWDEVISFFHSTLSEHVGMIKAYFSNDSDLITLEEITPIKLPTGGKSVLCVQSKTELFKLPCNSSSYLSHRLLSNLFYSKFLCSDCPPEKYEEWPTDRPPEIIYDPVTGQFKNPCPGVMPLPPEYNHGKSCVLLCDGDGNKVLLKITDNGITIAQQKYGQTTVIDPESGKVKTSQNSTAFIELTSETVFELPTPRSRTTIGVGESVKVTANTAVTWEINGVAFDKGTETATELTFTARDIAGSITVTAKNECDNESITFSVIKPNSIFYEVLGHAHLQDSLTAGMFLRARVQPATVNFGNIVIRELDSPAILTGILDDGKVHHHGKYPSGNSGDITLDPTNHNSDGTHTGRDDKNQLFDDFVTGGDNDIIPPGILGNGSARFEIEYDWKTVNGSKYHKFPNKVIQETVVTASGYVTTTKGNATVSFYYKDGNVNENYIKK